MSVPFPVLRRSRAQRASLLSLAKGGTQSDSTALNWKSNAKICLNVCWLYNDKQQHVSQDELCVLPHSTESYRLNACSLPPQRIVNRLAMLRRPASTHCMCTSTTCSYLNCTRISPPNPKERPQGETLTLSTSFDTFLWLLHAIFSVVASSLTWPTQHDSTHTL